MSHDIQPADDDRQRRIDALRALANDQLWTTDDQPTAHATASLVPELPGVSPKRPRRGARWIWTSVGLVALALAITVGVVAKLEYHPATVRTKPLPDPLVITTYLQFPAQVCPTAAAWSPDGTKIAVTGFQNCGSQIIGLPNGQFAQVPDQGGVLVIYDATNAHLVADVPLDEAVTGIAIPASVQGDRQALANVNYAYDDLTWSPNGQQIALTYSAGHLIYRQNGPNALSAQDVVYGSGVLLVDWARASERTLPKSAAVASSPTSGAVLWDLQNGTSTAINVPQAESFSWQGSNLFAGTPLPAATSGALPPVNAGPSGNPDGGQTFTMWQMGAVSIPQQCQSSAGQRNAPTQTCCPSGAYYTGQFGTPAAWSPDGRYLILDIAGNIGASGVIPTSEVPGAAPVPNTCTPHPPAATLAQLPIRDAAMRRIMASLVPTSSNPRADLSWSPDGKRLVSDVALDTAPGVALFAVYDCSSGKGVAVITQQQFLARVPLFHRYQEVPPPELAWSPNSQRLLAYDNTSGVIEVFGYKSLSSGVSG